MVAASASSTHMPLTVSPQTGPRTEFFHIMKKSSKKEVLSDSIRFFESHSTLFSNANASKKFIQNAIEEHPELNECLQYHFDAPIMPEELGLPFLDKDGSSIPFESMDPAVLDIDCRNVVYTFGEPITNFSEFHSSLIALQNEHFEVRPVANPAKHENLEGQKELAMRSDKNLKKYTFVGFFASIIPSPQFYECFLKVVIRILSKNAKKYQHEIFIQAEGRSSPKLSKNIYGLSIFKACNTARRPNGKPDEYRNNLDCVYGILKVGDQLVYAPGLITNRDVMQNESLCFDYRLGPSHLVKDRSKWVAGFLGIFQKRMVA